MVPRGGRTPRWFPEVLLFVVEPTCYAEHKLEYVRPKRLIGLWVSEELIPPLVTSVCVLFGSTLRVCRFVGSVLELRCVVL